MYIVIFDTHSSYIAYCWVSSRSLFSCFIAVTPPEAQFPVSLSNGSFGYVIIENNGTTGFVCGSDDDEFYNDVFGCVVVCRQAGFT